MKPSKRPTDRSAAQYQHKPAIRQVLKTLLLSALFMCLATVTALADSDVPNQSPINRQHSYFSQNISWTETEAGWTCSHNQTGEPMVNRWLAVYEKNGEYLNTEFYHFDANGIMQTGWFDDGDYRFYLQPSGRVLQARGIAEIDGSQYLFADRYYVMKNASTTIDGKHYTTDETGRVIDSNEDKTADNIHYTGDTDQLTYFNNFRKNAGISDLEADFMLNDVAKAAYDAKDGISLSTVYSLTSSITGRNIRHVAFISSTAFPDSSYVYLTDGAVDTLCHSWFTRIGYYKQDYSIMIILAAYDQEEASYLSADTAQGRWINDNGRYKYCRVDGTSAVNCWLKHPGDGEWYHFDADGYMQTGWFQDTDGKWYYLEPSSGKMLFNTTVDGYSLGADGAMIQ